MASWIYDEKFLMGTQFLFGIMLFTAKEDNNLEHPAQEQEERRRMTTSALSSLKASRTQRSCFKRQSDNQLR
jgi:hypothetical protein